MAVMLLLIPGLLLLTEYARYTAIEVGTPLFASGTRDSGVIACGRPGLEVTVAHGAYWTRHGGGEWTRVGAAADGLDHRALGGRARALKRQYPKTNAVTISAEGNVEFATIVRAIDALRGEDCQLSTIRLGESEPDECLFWLPIVRHRVADDEVPRFRGGSTWPPLPPRRVSG